ncbi:HEX1-like protein [Trichoderma ceciliae]
MAAVSTQLPEERRSSRPASNNPEREDREQPAPAISVFALLQLRLHVHHKKWALDSPPTAGIAPAANLDFEARVPVPFSIFPSTYKDNEAARPQTQINTHEEVQITLPQKKPAGREGQHSSFPPSAELVPHRGEHRIEEEVRITREEERYRRPGSHQSERFVKEEFRPIPPPPRDYTETQVKVDSSRRFTSPIDVAEREFRERFRPQQQQPQNSTGLELVPVRHSRHSEKASKVNEFTVDEHTTIARPNFREEIKITEEFRESTPYPSEQSAKMGYYDDEGSHHSIRQGVAKAVDKLLPHHHHHHHHHNTNNDTLITDHVEDARQDANASRRPAPAAESQTNTVSIPCHHIRLGDFLMLQGRPCQVIRISTSSATGQYRYLGVDLFTKQLHEESSFIANPAPSVVVQTMLGPVFKQYRVLDMADGFVTAMTETGDVKQGLSVIDQSNLWSRLQQAFESGRGSVRVLVLNDGGRELAVEMKVIHGSRL